MATAKKNKSLASPAVPGELHLPTWANPRRLSVVLMVIAFLLYANTFGHEYAQDDAIVITENMYTTQGIKGWAGIFSKDTFFGYFKVEGKDRLVSGGRYRPLSLALFAVEYQFFGNNPGIMHVFNALWYALVVWMVYISILWLFRLGLEKGTQLSAQQHYIAFAAALIFAVHPVHTEAVANIKGRDEIMSLLGSLAALICSLRAYHERHWRWLLPAVLAFFLGLLSKENAITFLAVVPLAIWLFGKATVGDTIRYSAPLLVAALAFLLLRGAVIGWEFGPESRELMNNPFLKIEGNRWVDFSASEKLATITYTLGKYLQLLVLPYPLTHDYYPRQIPVMGWADMRTLLSLLAYTALLVYGLRQLLARKPAAFMVWFFLATISIVSNLVFPIGTNMSERFLFMPSLAYGFAVAWLLAHFFIKKTTGRSQWTALWATTGLIVLVYAVLTLVRNPVWKNNYTLFTTDIQTSTQSAKLQNAAAGELSSYWLGLPDRDNRREIVERALGHAREAVRIHPGYLNAYLIMGNCYNYLQRYDESIEAYQKALAINPDFEQADINLALTYRDAGRYYGEQRQDLAKALYYLQEAWRRNPTDFETARLLGVANGMSGNHSKAIELFTKATELQPKNAIAWYDLGTAYIISGQPAVGQQFIDKAKALDPNVEQSRMKK